MKDLHEMTLEELAKYRGPLFHATLKLRGRDGKVFYSDLTSNCEQNEKKKINDSVEGARVVGIRYGPIVTENGMVIDRDPRTGRPAKDVPARYIRDAWSAGRDKADEYRQNRSVQ
jgi:hypothetical protein